MGNWAWAVGGLHVIRYAWLSICRLELERRLLHAQLPLLPLLPLDLPSSLARRKKWHIEVGQKQWKGISMCGAKKKARIFGRAVHYWNQKFHYTGKKVLPV